jgi:wyosine [tRNA(Phe)-imidazoG37] synthetase (radical SAM superfamily)
MRMDRDCTPFATADAQGLHPARAGCVACAKFGVVETMRRMACAMHLKGESMSAHVFGPVPSRRLGRSLGIDPIPLKTCNWNCVYCQLGRTSPLVTARDEYVDAGAVVAEVRAYLEEHGEDSFDWITFVGSGEPTLHWRLGWMIREVKSLTRKPIAVITNGALLADAEVRAELLAADAVMPTISVGSERTYLRLHRPAHGLDFASFIAGLVAFRDAYQGRLWAEVMLVAGYNDGDDELAALRALLARVRPDEIQIVLPTRPPAMPDVRAASADRVALAARILGEVAPVRTATDVPDTTASGTDLDETIVGLVQRHPMTEAELAALVKGFSPEQIGAALEALGAAGRVHSVERCGRRFFTSAGARYGAS